MSKNICTILKRAVYTWNQQTVTSYQVRLYGRWMHRKPAKVLLPFEPTTSSNLKKEKVINLDPNKFIRSQESNIDTEQTDPVKQETVLCPEKVEEIKQKRETKQKKRKFYLSQKKIFDDNNEIIYEKLNDNDGRISPLLVKLRSKKERQRTKQVLVEGWRLIVDGLEANCNLMYILFSRLSDLNKLRSFLPNTGVQIYKISYKEVQLWSNVETPPGIFGIFEIPNAEKIKRLSKPLPLQIICDNIREPGNLGAILRAAVGVGCNKVLLSKGCVDLWDPKVIRSAAGAHFRQPIYSSIDWDEMPKLLPKDTSVFIADSNATQEYEGNLGSNKYECHETLPVLPYYGIDFARLSHVTLIIGGETEGVGEHSYRLAEKKNGLRLNIPLQKGVDSLNTGMAAAVIAFEIRKQFVQQWAKLKLRNQAIQAT